MGDRTKKHPWGTCGACGTELGHAAVDGICEVCRRAARDLPRQPMRLKIQNKPARKKTVYAIRGPSVKSMMSAFESTHGLILENAKLLKAVMQGTRDSKQECEKLGIKTQHTSREGRILLIANKVLNGHGVEYIRSKQDTFATSQGIEYVNTGDTYDTTLIYDCRSKVFHLTSWGDIVERNPRRFEETINSSGYDSDDL